MRVWQFLAEHPTASPADVAMATHLRKSTVKRALARARKNPAEIAKILESKIQLHVESYGPALLPDDATRPGRKYIQRLIRQCESVMAVANDSRVPSTVNQPVDGGPVVSAEEQPRSVHDRTVEPLVAHQAGETGPFVDPDEVQPDARLDSDSYESEFWYSLQRRFPDMTDSASYSIGILYIHSASPATVEVLVQALAACHGLLFAIVQHNAARERHVHWVSPADGCMTVVAAVRPILGDDAARSGIKTHTPSGNFNLLRFLRYLTGEKDVPLLIIVGSRASDALVQTLHQLVQSWHGDVPPILHQGGRHG
jgi:hypothetical protein